MFVGVLGMLGLTLAYVAFLTVFSAALNPLPATAAGPRLARRHPGGSASSPSMCSPAPGQRRGCAIGSTPERSAPRHPGRPS